ncbi:MAG: hypothetical protein FWH22_04280 [Fibromonadales bacterium]|nr:hypothetical protein [Fibromonadales bacterium]
MDIKEYKCPNCSGAVKFDSSSQKMKCPYCDTEFEIEALEEYQKEIGTSAQDNFGWSAEQAGKPWENPELDELSSGACPSCGAELLGDQNTAAMVCPCCGNAQIVSKRLSGLLKPDYLIPFKLEKNNAMDALKNFCKGKRLLPDYFIEDNNISCVQGLYVPFWLFDAQAHGHICYKANKVKTWSDSNYNYTKTDFYSVVRDGSMAFEKIPVDGSEKMDDSYMDAIEPFDYAQMKDFHTSFLAGYVAEKYDVTAENCKGRAGQRIKTTMESEFARTVTGYSSVRTESSAVDVKSGKVSYAFFPVWVLNTKYKKENYLFMMNGQTGRLVGRLPIDSLKAWKYRGLFTGIFGIIFTILIYFLYQLDAMAISVMWLFSLIMGFMIVHYWKIQMDTARLKTQATEYIVPDSLFFREKKDRFLYSTLSKVKRQQVNKASAP